jgi:hypothetical protein
MAHSAEAMTNMRAVLAANSKASGEFHPSELPTIAKSAAEMTPFARM